MAKVMHPNRVFAFASHWAAVLVCALVALLIAGAGLVTVPSRALAAEGESLSLTVKSQCGCVFSGQEQVSVWRVAQVGEDGSLAPLEDFVGVSANWGDSDADAVRVLANGLSEFVEKSDIAPTASVLMDKGGTAVFSEGLVLESGYYLVIGDRHQADGVCHEFMPALVMLSQASQNGTSDSASVVIMKHSVCEEDGDQVRPETPKPSIGSRLPQTGQLWWPVPVLFMVGVVLFVAGASKRLRK